MQVFPPSHVLCLHCPPLPQLVEHPLQVLHELCRKNYCTTCTITDHASHLSNLYMHMQEACVLNNVPELTNTTLLICRIEYQCQNPCSLYHLHTFISVHESCHCRYDCRSSKLTIPTNFLKLYKGNKWCITPFRIVLRRVGWLLLSGWSLTWKWNSSWLGDQGIFILAFDQAKKWYGQETFYHQQTEMAEEKWE